MVLIQAHHFLSEYQRAADEKALYMGEPAGVLHLPDSTSYGKYIQIAGLQEPYDAIFLIFPGKIRHPVVTRSQQIYQTVHTAAQQAS